ncbi:hypothetical protein ACT3CD_06010 [Geofilum sp. OHC36d9]|uniref:hypothetical protein n=1 Tax=Geofilum sp. OHC36d9 TaxID=3458413 RepID=UPI0040334DA9
MLYKEEEDGDSLLFVNDCFYDKRNAEVDLIDKHYLNKRRWRVPVAAVVMADCFGFFGTRHFFIKVKMLIF